MTSCAEHRRDGDPSDPANKLPLMDDLGFPLFGILAFLVGLGSYYYHAWYVAHTSGITYAAASVGMGAIMLVMLALVILAISFLDLWR